MISSEKLLLPFIGLLITYIEGKMYQVGKKVLNEVEVTTNGARLGMPEDVNWNISSVGGKAKKELFGKSKMSSVSPYSEDEN